ncbi:MAG: amidohydrolase [Pyrinomonadaceae bacterium]|nr:amidohydrolase [Pyrinomonadaceae bacterium]
MLKNLIKIALVASLLLPNLVLAQAKQKISMLLYNGKVFTADEKFTIVEAVAIDGEKIIAVGTSRELKAKYAAAKEIDLRGRLVTPGFNDAHVHFFRGALSLLTVNLLDAKTVDEATRRVAVKVKETKTGEWIIGRGWDHTLWGNKFPNKNDLDRIAPNNPVFLVRVDGHIGWANSAALKLAKIDKSTKNTEGGEIERDAAGEATGILKETAQALVGGLIPQPNKEQQIKGMELALKMAREYGITSVQDNSGYETTKLYREFLNQNKLTVRVAEWQDFEDSVVELKRQRAEFDSFKDDANRLKLTALKGYVDGTLGSKTASMLAPFTDDDKNVGIMRRPPEELTRMIVERDAAGFQIALHAIGDKANRMALDGFEQANKTPLSADLYGKTPTVRSGVIDGGTRFYVANRRNRIEHAQVVNPADFKRFQELGIIASMQPTHAVSDKRWADSRLGEYRVLGAYAWHLMKSYNVHVPFGTDFPVEAINPYATLYAAVSRQDAEGIPAGGWQPQERLSIEDAIRCHTFEAAYAEFAENVKGEIKAGMLADLVVHSKDLTTIQHPEILTTAPVYTIFNGQIIYEKK